MDLTHDEQIMVIDSLVTMLGIALSRSSALRHHSNVKQAESFAAQATAIRKLIGKLETAWPQTSTQTILKF